MSVMSQLRAGLTPLVDLVYPPRCPVCGEWVGQHGGLCLDCWSDLAIPGEPACASCSRPLGTKDAGDGAAQCAPCFAKTPRYAGIAAGTLYNDVSRKLVLAFKHGGKIGLAPLLARLISAKIPLGGDIDKLLVPVPLHRWRLWKRGYNQAALLAKELEKLGKGKSVPDGLQRVRATRSLGGMGRKDREKELKGAIRVAPRHLDRIRGQRIILVDDVLTSGATADSCVATLLKSGAESVEIACFARVLDEALPQSRTIEELKSETPEVQWTPGAT